MLTEVGVAAALAVAVDRALDVAHAGRDRRQRVGHRELRVVVGVDAPETSRGAAVAAVLGRARTSSARRSRRARRSGCRRSCRTGRASARRRRERPGAWPGRRPGRPCSRRRSARRRRPPRGRRAHGKATESATMARFSSGVAPRTSRTWSSQLLPKIVTTGVSAATRASRFGSVSARLVRWRVEPKAARRRVLPVDRLGGGEEVDVLGVGARPAALDVGEAELVEPARDLDLVGEREDEALALRAVAQRRVVEDHRLAHSAACGDRVPSLQRARATRAPPATASAMACVPTCFVPVRVACGRDQIGGAVAVGQGSGDRRLDRLGGVGLAERPAQHHRPGEDRGQRDWRCPCRRCPARSRGSARTGRAGRTPCAARRSRPRAACRASRPARWPRPRGCRRRGSR